MRFNLTIASDNAAFDDDPAAEVVGILTRLAEHIARHGLPDYAAPLFDVNGNRVGTYTYEEDGP